MNFIEKNQSKFDEIMEFIKNELVKIRTGRANPVMVEDILIEAYGAKTPLKQIASINVPEARIIVIQPWDKNIIKDVEKSLREADLGLSITNEGSLLRLAVPQLTEESRKELVKKVAERLEQGRIRLRHLRDDIKEEILQAEKNKEITEDDRYDFVDKLDETTREYQDKIKEVGAKKQQEIMIV